jgi:hypothetical protein
MRRAIELLGARGLALDWAEYIGDDRERITATLRRTLAGRISSSARVASAPRLTTTRANAWPRRWAWIWHCTPRRAN